MDHSSIILDDLLDQRRIESALRARSYKLPLRVISSRFSGAATHLADRLTPQARAMAAYIPGRIEFLGKHTDYAGGQSLTCAVQRAFCMVAARSKEPGLFLEDQMTGSRAFLPYRESEEPDDSAAQWTVYPQAVVRRFVSNFGIPDTGISIVFNSNIPRASGMSSSSALVIGIWLCLAGLTRVDEIDAFKENITSPADLAEFLGCIENGASFRELAGDTGVGTMGGAQDHTAILHSRASELGYFGYRPLKRLGRIAIPNELSFVVASSGVHANKTMGALQDYNDAVNLAKRATEIWSADHEGKANGLEQVTQSPAFSEELFRGLVEKAEPSAETRTAILRRVKQFALETGGIIPGAIEALETGDYTRLGALVSESQMLADECLRNQVPETRFLVEAALGSGAIAASSFGAGFGGSVYALVQKKAANTTLRKWMASYGTRFAERLRHACFFTDPTGPGAFVLGVDPERLLLEAEF